MNRYEVLLRKFKNREKIQGTAIIMLNYPLLVEKMINPELDFILMDAEHGCFDTQNVVPMLHTCRMLGMPSFVRVQDSQYHLIAKAIDMGADGVMIPRVETLEQMHTVIDALRFGPIGRKGAGGYAQFRAGESFEEFQNSRMLLIQIESPKGVENLPVMLKTYGEHISGVIIGPNDLSVMVGTPFDTRSDPYQAAIRQVFEISRAHGKSCGIFCNDAGDAKHYRAMGANVLWTASDLQFYMRGYLETLDELRQIP
ncbi:MAG: HpcH/HpaI aldolase family protein [Christensenellales bacterium]|jgi:2-keto-3-deoxy-L-rhamnonate aldolase RhmA